MHQWAVFDRILSGIHALRHLDSGKGRAHRREYARRFRLHAGAAAARASDLHSAMVAQYDAFRFLELDQESQVCVCALCVLCVCALCVCVCFVCALCVCFSL